MLKPVQLDTGNAWRVEFDGAVTLNSLQRACHHLSDKLDLSIESLPSGAWAVCVFNEVSDRSLVARDLRRTVLDFSVRAEIEARTEPIRRRLVEVALAEAAPMREPRR
jgi:hypothetical protein